MTKQEYRCYIDNTDLPPETTVTAVNSSEAKERFKIYLKNVYPSITIETKRLIIKENKK